MQRSDDAGSVDPRIADIIRSLYRLTKSGKIRWEILVTRREPLMYSTTNGSYELTAKNGDRDRPILLRIMNSAGVEIQRFESDIFVNGGSLMDPWDARGMLVDLYFAALRQALHVDESLDLLVAELRQEEGEK